MTFAPCGIVWPCGGTRTGLKAADLHVKVASREESNLRSSRVFATQLLRPETCWPLQEVMESFKSSTSTLRAPTRCHKSAENRRKLQILQHVAREAPVGQRCRKVSSELGCEAESFMSAKV